MMIYKNALLADGSYQDIAVEKGIIVEISPNTILRGKTLDCEGRLLLSGMIDPHVHFRDPGLTHKEDAESGTKAALRGGVTSIIDMPNTSPLCVTEEALQEKRSIYQNKAFCNFGFHFGGDARDNSQIIPKIKNTASVKIFLNESTGHMLITEEEVLNKLFQNSKLITVHAEGDAVDKAIFLAKKYDTALYLCHISQEGELKFIEKAKNKNAKIFAEVCPHHVLFNDSNQSSLLTMKPCLRSLRDQESLLEGLDKGLIDTWGTDHAPHLITEKNEKPTYGVGGIEFALELLLTLAKEMNWPYKKVQNLYSENTKNIFKIIGKGTIEIGYDADFVLIDQNTPYTISNEDIVSQAGWSPYIGKTVCAKINSTFIGGEEVYNTTTKKYSLSNYIKELTYE